MDYDEPNYNTSRNDYGSQGNNEGLAFVISTLVIITTCIVVFYSIKSTIPKNILCTVPISYYLAKLGDGPLITPKNTFDPTPKYLTELKYCEIDQLPKLSKFINSRYIAIINTQNFPISIPGSSITVHTSETDAIPVNPINANVVKATLAYPDATLGRDVFVFNNMSTYNGNIGPNEIALIKFVSNNPIYLYSINFKYISSETIPLTLFVFNPTTNVDYQSGEFTTFKSFYQLNLNSISRNTSIVIDFQ